MAGWLKAGLSVFATGALLEFVLIVVALAQIESPTSYTWVTLHIAALFLLICGQITISISRKRK